MRPALFYRCWIVVSVCGTNPFAKHCKPANHIKHEIRTHSNTMIVKTSRAQVLKAVGLMFHTAWHHVLSHRHFESHTGGMTRDGKEQMHIVEK